jgi:hypothetical protein
MKNHNMCYPHQTNSLTRELVRNEDTQPLPLGLMNGIGVLTRSQVSQIVNVRGPVIIYIQVTNT